MLTRKIGQILRGSATPYQLFTACILGSILGFLPGFMQAPGLIVLFTLLLIVLNANLALAALVLLAAKVLSLLLTPVSFQIGRWLLDGATQGLFAALINAPILAWFGFEYYLTTGALTLGIVFGLMAGIGVTQLITAFRRKMSHLEDGSETFKAFTQKSWVRVLTFILVGGSHGKLSYSDLLERKVGNPIRPLGAVAALGFLGLLALFQLFAAGPILTAVIKGQVEQANGATVDLASANLSLMKGHLALSGLAVADPNALDTDLFRAARLEADFHTADLLRKRVQLDRLVFTDASSGELRDRRAKLIRPAPQPVAQPSPAPIPADAKGLEDYLRDAQVWKDRLAQAKHWLEQVPGPADSKPQTQTPDSAGETLQERLERQIRELGYARVKAAHRIEDSPTLSILELIAEKVRVPGLQDETLDVRAFNLSTHPALLKKAPQITVQSSAGTLFFDTTMAALVPSQRTDISGTLKLQYHGLPTEWVASQLIVDGTAPIQGGTIDLDAEGSWSMQPGLAIDLPVEFTLHDVTLSLPSVPPTHVEHLTLPIRLEGTFDNPRVQLDSKALVTALAKGAVSKITDQIQDQAQQKLGEQLKGKTDAGKAKGFINNFLGGGKQPDSP